MLITKTMWNKKNRGSNILWLDYNSTILDNSLWLKLKSSHNTVLHLLQVLVGEALKLGVQQEKKTSQAAFQEEGPGKETWARTEQDQLVNSSRTYNGKHDWSLVE